MKGPRRGVRCRVGANEAGHCPASGWAEFVAEARTTRHDGAKVTGARLHDAGESAAVEDASSGATLRLILAPPATVWVVVLELKAFWKPAVRCGRCLRINITIKTSL